MYLINFEPTYTQLIEIENWLRIESQNTGEGFYCNWNIIKTSFQNNKLVVISYRKKVVGFLTFQDYNNDKCIKIEIAEVKNTYRNKGVGKRLINEFLAQFRNKGFLVAILDCCPNTSKPIWKKIGFYEYPERIEQYSYLSIEPKPLYRILTNCLEPNVPQKTNEQIELWNKEHFSAMTSESKQIWEIEFIQGTRKLIKPIIYPINREWRIRWILNNKVIFDNMIKYFPCEIIFGTFMVIESLPKITNRN